MNRQIFREMIVIYFDSFQPWIIVAIFYIVIGTSICVLGQAAILIKKFIEYCKERKVQNNVNVMIKQNNQPINNLLNNADWNHQICNNYGLLQ